MNLLKRFFILILFLLANSSFAVSTFFAKSLMRSLFDIEVTEEKVISTELDKTTQKESKMSSFNLLVWNIYKGELFKKSPLPVNYHDFKVILLQEFSQGVAQNYLPKEKNLYFLPTFKWEGEKTGVATYSESKLTHIIPLHTKYREPFIITPKASLIVKYRGITIVNTHALNFVSEKEWIFELDEISKLIKDKKKVIWAGDFNTWNTERTHYLLGHMNQLGLQEVKFTGSQKIPQEDKRTLHLGFPVDYIFVKGIRYTNQSTVEASDYSDHNPLFLTIHP